MTGADGVLPVLITFEPHPAAVLAPGRVPPMLMTIGERVRMAGEAGIGACIVLRSSAELFELSAEEFLERLVSACRPHAIVEGTDFRFGKARRGTVQTLAEYGARHGFAVEIMEPVRCEELPGRPVVSSSAIRTALSAGDMATATAMLGRPHAVSGVVVQGDGRGARIGFPTANLAEIAEMLPAEGVYAGRVTLADGSRWVAAVNVGPQPTFGQTAVRVEAHLLDYHGNLYGQAVRVEFVAGLRGVMKFAGAEALVAQIRRDGEAARGVVRFDE